MTGAPESPLLLGKKRCSGQMRGPGKSLGRLTLLFGFALQPGLRIWSDGLIWAKAGPGEILVADLLGVLRFSVQPGVRRGQIGISRALTGAANDSRCRLRRHSACDLQQLPEDLRLRTARDHIVAIVIVRLPGELRCCPGRRPLELGDVPDDQFPQRAGGTAGQASSGTRALAVCHPRIPACRMDPSVRTTLPRGKQSGRRKKVSC